MRLPRYASSFVGRQRELAALEGAVARASIVTLVGFAGVGKTRLALAFAADRAVLYCDLSAALTSADLCDAVARVLALPADVSQGRHEPLARRIGDDLARRDRPLLLLDNFEQLGEDATSTLDGWRALAPGAVFVVTSRRPTGLRDELVVPIAPLEHGDAAKLFHARAAIRLHGAGGLASDAQLVAQVVGRLEGIPLALELAAARLDVLPLSAIAEGLDERFRMLRDPLSEDERHGTLWRAIDWSWRLLLPWQRAALAQLSVFEAGFAIEDAAAVVVLPNTSAPRRDAAPAAEPDAEDAPTCLDAIHALVRQSLARIDTPEAVRFSLFDAVRDFAARRLDEGERRAVRERHARWFVARGRKTANAIDLRGSLDGIRSLDRDRADLTAVLRRALAVEPPTSASARDASGALLALLPLLVLRGSADERLSLFDAVIPAVQAVSAEGAAGEASGDAMRLALGRAQALRQLGRVDEALAVIDRTLVDARASGARRVEGRLLEEASYARTMCGQLASARALADEAAAIFRATGDVRHEGIAHTHLAFANIDLGNLAISISHADRARALFRAVGASLDEGAAVLMRGIAAFESGDAGAARAYLEEAAAMHRAAGERREEARARGYLGGMAHDAGELDVARAAYDDARRAFADVGDRRLEAIDVGYVGLVDAQRGDVEGGVVLLSRARDALTQVGDARYVATMDAALAGVRALRGDTEGAEVELARIERALSAHGSPCLARLADVYRGVVQVVGGDRESARALADELSRVPADDVRLALPLLRRALREADERARTWTFDANGTRFRPAASDEISLETRVPLARILGALARARVAQPGEPLAKEELARAAWPDEARLEPTSANNRLKVAVSTLRKLGLEPLLVTRAGGYLFDPEVPIRVVEEKA